MFGLVIFHSLMIWRFMWRSSWRCLIVNFTFLFSLSQTFILSSLLTLISILSIVSMKPIGTCLQIIKFTIKVLLVLKQFKNFFNQYKVWDRLRLNTASVDFLCPILSINTIVKTYFLLNLATSFLKLLGLPIY